VSVDVGPALGGQWTHGQHDGAVQAGDFLFLALVLIDGLGDQAGMVGGDPLSNPAGPVLQQFRRTGVGIQQRAVQRNAQDRGGVLLGEAGQALKLLLGPAQP